MLTSPAMLTSLASRDEPTREQALGEIESAAAGDADEVARLFAELTAIDAADELGVSYQVLALSIVVRIDAAGPLVLRLDGDAHRRLQPFIGWWRSAGQQDGPPWREDCGWVDSVGHGAELAGAVGQHPSASAAAVGELAAVTAHLAQSDRRFLASEDDRLALAFASLAARAPAILDDLEPENLWVMSSATNPFEPGWASTLNLHGFLCHLSTIWTFGVTVVEAGIDLPHRGPGSPEFRWLRRALASTDTSGLWTTT